MSITNLPQTPFELAEHLQRLEAERALAGLEGLNHDGPYMDDLLDEIAACRAAYVGAAVTDIAILRAALGDRGEG